MSDHDASPDPMDKAYARAEAMLDDEAARAARRARVLGAVAEDAAAAPATPPKPRASWTAGAWLAAASVAGVSLLVAVQLSLPSVRPKPPAPASAPAKAPAVAAPPPVTAPPPATVDEAAPPARPADRQAPVLPPSDVAKAAPPLELPPAQARAPAVPPVAPPPAAPRTYDSGVEALIVQSHKREESLQAPPPSAPFDSTRAQRAAPSPSAQTAKLHEAALAGRLSELTDLLAQGIPVDATDSAGETALMKAVRARRPAAAALLRGHGANLDRTNDAGVSARAMAAAIDDPGLNRALGLEP